MIRTWTCFLFWRYGVAETKCCMPLLSLVLHVCFRPCWSDVRPQVALGCREHVDSIYTHTRRAGVVRRARLCSSSSCANHDGGRGAEISSSSCASQDGSTGAEIGRESMQTAFARIPGGQVSSGAPVSTAVAGAQATTGAEAQKLVSYGQVTSMATVATGARQDVQPHFCCLELQCLHMV